MDAIAGGRDASGTPLERDFAGLLVCAEHEARFDLLNAFDLGELFADEGFVGTHVFDDDFEHEVGVAGNVIALEDLGDVLDCAAEALDRLLLVQGEGDRDPGDDFEAQAVGVEVGIVTLDEPGSLQRADALQNRGWRQPDALREVGVCDSPVGLQDRKDLHVGLVKMSLDGAQAYSLRPKINFVLAHVMLWRLDQRG